MPRRRGPGCDRPNATPVPEPGATSEESTEFKRLKRENAELRRVAGDPGGLCALHAEKAKLLCSRPHVGHLLLTDEDYERHQLVAGTRLVRRLIRMIGVKALSEDVSRVLIVEVMEGFS